MENIILMGYPRSGNNWLRYILEYLTKKNSYGNLHISGTPSPNACEPIRQEYPGELGENDSDSGEILFAHGVWKHYMEYYFRDTKLVFPLRSYKECVVRQQSKHTLYDKMNKEFLWDCIKLNLNEKNVFYKSEGLPTYLDHLYLFDKWESEKLIVYYEDLIQDLSETLNKIVKFLGVDKERKNLFLDKLDIHKQNSLAFYGKYIAVPESGDNIHHHQTRIYGDRKNTHVGFDDDFWNEIDYRLKDNEHLKRYGV